MKEREALVRERSTCERERERDKSTCCKKRRENKYQEGRREMVRNSSEKCCTKRRELKRKEVRDGFQVFQGRKESKRKREKKEEKWERNERKINEERKCVVSSSLHGPMHLYETEKHIFEN